MPSARRLFDQAPPDGRALVAPSILSADFAHLADDCAHVLRAPAEGGAGADLLHVDIMDGHFVPNLTMGPALVASLRRALPDAFLDVHVMVTDPIQYVAPFAEAGADHLTFHVEPALDPRAGAGMAPLSAGYDVAKVAGAIRDSGMTAGLAINPPTELSDAIVEMCRGFELVLVMSVNPGFSGQAFIPGVLGKVRTLRDRLGAGVRIEMDGGVAPSNAGACRDAGADVLVAASAVFGVARADRARSISELRG